MSAPSSPPSTKTAAAKAGETSLVAEIDQSCRWSLLYLFGASAFWLLLASVLSLVASIKLHSPAFLAECSALSYGRVQAMASSLYLYGFASQAGLGIGLWMLARLGRVTLQLPLWSIIGGVLWNLGLTVGLIEIAYGHNTGYTWLEIPATGSGIIFLGYCLLAINALLTFRARTVRETYVSQWYLVAALLCFPWLYTTANCLLVHGPLRGVTQSIANQWFVSGFGNLWLGSLALAALFYFVPVVIGKPLNDRHLALFGFWVLMLTGAWTGFHSGSPFPAWVPSASSAMTLLLAVAAAAVVVNFHLTIRRDPARLTAEPANCFLAFGVVAFGAWNVLLLLTALPKFSGAYQLTHFFAGVAGLGLKGFVGMTLVGSALIILPRVVDVEWPAPGLVRLQLWTLGGGVVLSTIALCVAGVDQGAAMKHADSAFLGILKSTHTMLLLNTAGSALFALGALLLFANFVLILDRFARTLCPLAFWLGVGIKPGDSKITA